MKLELNKSTKEKPKIMCRVCKGPTKHTVHASVDTSGSEDMGYGNSFDWYESYQILQCDGCESLTFRKESSDSEDIVQVAQNEWEHAVREDLYPSPVAGRQPVADVDLLPQPIQRIYVETIKALNSQQPILTGIGIRALVETVCKEKKANGTLEQQIDQLVGKGVLTKEGADILHQLRVLGNVAAHEVKPHPEGQLSVAINVIDHLLQGVYILPVHAKKNLPARA